MAFKLILGPAVIPPGLRGIVLLYAALVPLLLTGCMLLMGVKDQMHKIDRSTLPEWVLASGLEHRLHPYAASSRPAG